jgi:hypothetical protein
MLTKQIEPVRYAAIEPSLTGITFSSRQDVGELKRFLEAVIAAIESVTPKMAVSNSDAKAKLTAVELHGYWESVEVTLVEGSNKLALRPDGKFLYGRHDVSTGWTTIAGGTWELKGGRVVLNAEFRNHDGKEVEVGKKKTEELSAMWKDGEWRLGGGERPELKRVRNELALADYLTLLKKTFETSQFYSPPFDGPLAAKVQEADLPMLVELMASEDLCAATVRPGTAVVRVAGAPAGSTVGHEAAVLIDSFRLARAYPIADSSTDHKIDRETLLQWWKEKSERADPGKAD